MRLIRAVVALLLLVGTPSLLAGELPKDWFLAGSSPKDYTAEIDRSNRHTGAASALLASTSEDPKGFGTLMQTTASGAFTGKRVRFTAYARSVGVNRWAGLWLRVDGSGTAPLAFDNMQDRPIKGDTAWNAYSIVLDVPQQATALAFGVLLDGGGKVWMDSGVFEVVDSSVPTTGTVSKPGPSNLDFEE